MMAIFNSALNDAISMSWRNNIKERNGGVTAEALDLCEEGQALIRQKCELRGAGKYTKRSWSTEEYKKT